MIKRSTMISPSARDEMLDAAEGAESARIMADIAAGRRETLTEGETAAYIEAPTPLAFWRKKRKSAQKDLAAEAGISQSDLAGLEAGDRKGDPALFLKLARALDVRMENIVQDSDV